MTVTALETCNLTKRFSRGTHGVTALDDVSLRIEEGEFVSIVGASGCGKSTLLRLVDGLTAPSSGEVLLGGKPVRKPGPDRAFVFQQDCLFPWRTIIENVTFGPEVQGVRKAEARDRGRDLLDLVGLTGFESHYPHELSGGMRQRANLARAFAVDPEVLLMDEPFAALDGQTRELMQEELLRIWEQSRKTVLFVTHQIDEAVYLSDRVVVMTARPGRVKAEVHIDLPRPRALSMKRSSELAAHEETIWNLIQEEVKESMRLEGLHGKH